MPHPRSSIRISQVAATAAVALALFTVPAAAFGQAPSVTKVQNVEKPHPAPASYGTATMENVQTAEPAKAEGGSEAKPSQEEQEHGFLVNGAIVKAISKATGWSPDVTATVFLWFNFAVLFFGVAIPLAKVLPKIFRKRAQTLSHNLVEARKATEEANARLSAVEAKLDGLDVEIAKFRANVEEESKSDEQRIKASIEEEKTRIVASAEQELAVAAALARRNLRSFATELAIEQAAKQLTLTPETDRALIAEFIGDAAKGGKN